MFPLLRRLRARFGYDQYSAKTIDRLLYSQHVEDLQWIASACTLSAVVVISALVLIAVSVFAYEISAGGGFKYAELYKVVLTVGVATFVGLGGIIAWCYKTGSLRLGMIDLFACEITTLCRICVINDLARGCIEAFKMDVGTALEKETYYSTIEGARARFRFFESAEAYTPIFDANAKELQSLEVKVVVNVTAFYTYWKSMRDAFRKLADIEREKTTFRPEERTSVWPRTMRNVVYMLFLACESARKSVRDLIEFEPNNAENGITILLCELPCWRFLVDNFPCTDVRHKRLLLRQARYKEVIPKFIDDVRIAVKKAEKRAAEMAEAKARGETGSKSADRLANREEVYRDWKKAGEMLEDLEKAFADAMAVLPNKEPAPA